MSTPVKKLMNLCGRTAVVTGATGYLGRVIAETLAELGSNLILVDRPGSQYEEIKKMLIDTFNVQVVIKNCDLEDQKQREHLISCINSEYSSISILINNAAFTGGENLSGWAVPFEQQTVETWRRALEVNLTASFEMCQGLCGVMSKSAGASIINIGSIYGMYGPDWNLYEGTSMGNPGAYAASKGGLIQLTKWLATTVAPKIRVNAVSPGGIFRNQPEKFVEKYITKTPLNRMGSEDDFRGVITYLASDMSSYVTGQNIVVDGGFGAW